MTIQIPIFVHAYETDFAGVVSNTRYIEWLERGRYALLRAANVPVNDLWENDGIVAVVRKTEIEYLGFARHEDELMLEVTVKEHSKTTSTLAFEVRKVADGSVTARARQTLAYINRGFRATRTPLIYREKLPAPAQVNAEFTSR